ncbi:MAG: nitroreductase [Clostridia bacterium]|nr:nitroreductase [Clostridia bacterium]
MNETLETMLARKSCRSFKKEQIKDEELRAVVDAGLAAPSGRNLQPTLIIAVQDRETIDKLSRLNAAVMGVDSDPFYGAPTVVVVLAKKSSRTSLEDGSLVLGNMLLAAYSIGLGSCWIHRARETFESEEGKALLAEWGIDGEVYGVGNCILGYPDGELHDDFLKNPERAIVIK